jgi:DNA-binding beta-propeller fold protein YncE
MLSKTPWSRRRFLSATGVLSASALIRPTSFPFQAGSFEVARPYLACTISHDLGAGSLSTLSAFVVEEGDCRKVASKRCPDAIGAVAIHPHHKRVYVAHDTASYLNLPRSSVSALALDELSGEFVEISREPLNLSATRPRHLAVSPDGRVLLVAATGGGAYNAFSLTPDGSILPQARAIKLTRYGPHPLQSTAQPIFVRFTPSGKVAYACDFGGDRVDQLRFTDNVPTLEGTMQLTPGTGPCYLAIHPSQPLLAVVGVLGPTLSILETDAQTGALTTIRQPLTLPVVALDHASFSHSGDDLFVAGCTKSGLRMLFTVELNRLSRPPRLATQEVISLVADPRHQPSTSASTFPQSEHYRLVATNLPVPYSPIVTSPENVLPSYSPVKT